MILVTLSLLPVGLACGPSGRNLQVTFNSEPPGARLYADGAMKGYCPVTLSYHIANSQAHQVNLGQFKAYWNDGYCFENTYSINMPQWRGYTECASFLISRPYSPPRAVAPPQQQQQQQQQQVIT